VRGERRDVVVSMKETICNLRVVVHVDDIQDEHTAYLSSNHVALRDGFLFFELIVSLF
jgi:hypothetical protein